MAIEAECQDAAESEDVQVESPSQECVCPKKYEKYEYRSAIMMREVSECECAGKYES